MPRLALLQSTTFPSKAESFDHHEDLIRQTAASGANFIVTQELFLTPYFCTVEDPALFDLADPLPGPVMDRLGKLTGLQRVIGDHRSGRAFGQDRVLRDELDLAKSHYFKSLKSTCRQLTRQNGRSRS